ncbi:hypothetical protein CRYUN_Cryun09bG0212700 [Craigia yunnanensis]
MHFCTPLWLRPGCSQVCCCAQGFANNLSKLLLHIPVSRRHDAVVTISYEAQARLSDPVYGCVNHTFFTTTG